MTPAQLRELAAFQEERAASFYELAEFCAKDKWRETPAGIESQKHNQSAAIIRWAADVLEAETVAACKHEPMGHFVVNTDDAYLLPGCGEFQLIIKPTFGDDNDQS